MYGSSQEQLASAPFRLRTPEKITPFVDIDHEDRIFEQELKHKREMEEIERKQREEEQRQAFFNATVPERKVVIKPFFCKRCHKKVIEEDHQC